MSSDRSIVLSQLDVTDREKAEKEKGTDIETETGSPKEGARSGEIETGTDRETDRKSNKCKEREERERKGSR